MTKTFDHSLAPDVLHWLSAGQLASRWQRAVRLWWILRSLYGTAAPLALPHPFRYSDLRAHLFAPNHDEQRSANALSGDCRNTRCLCQRSLQDLLEAEPPLNLADWIAGMEQYTGLPQTTWQGALKVAPFAVVHRSIRDDLKLLVGQGWLAAVGRGRFARVSPGAWPTPPKAEPSGGINGLSVADIRELLPALEAIAFVQPNLDVILNRLWEQLAQLEPGHRWEDVAPERRIFTHLDYILPPESQEQVDNHQTMIEQLWRTHDGGMIQFEYWRAGQEQLTTVTVYPVCLHYARRAKYLSAYGIDPSGALGWHNYRLDRVTSRQLSVLPWGDPQVPSELRQMRDRGELPAPSIVETALEEALGFNFYLPKAWLLMRFPPKFARWYVDNTLRHPTFGRIAYSDLRAEVERYVPEVEQARVMAVLEGRSPEDAYYAGWIRVGDINAVMRLRDWRPNGEVIAPWGVRRQMALEVGQEAAHYSED